MSLHISFVEPATTAAYMIGVFEDTFGVDITVEFSPVKKNKYGLNYKMATIKPLNSSREFERFKTQIRQHGSNILIHCRSESWTVRNDSTEIAVNYRKAFIQ